MNVHITRDELIRYFEIVFSENPTEDDSEFAEEIDAHVAECDECFGKMQMMRIMLQGFSSDASLANSLIRSEFPEPLYKPAFDIKKVFAGIRAVKGILAGKLQVLADMVPGKTNAVFAPDGPALAATRGESKADAETNSLNDILNSTMEIPLDDGRKISLRCRESGSSNKIRLFVYSNFNVDFILTVGETVVEPAKKEYDPAAEETVWVYDISGDSFELKAK